MLLLLLLIIITMIIIMMILITITIVIISLIMIIIGAPMKLVVNVLQEQHHIPWSARVEHGGISDAGLDASGHLEILIIQ